MVENAITPRVTQEIIFIAFVLFFALKYRQANVRCNVILLCLKLNSFDMNADEQVQYFSKY